MNKLRAAQLIIATIFFSTQVSFSQSKGIMIIKLSNNSLQGRQEQLNALKGFNSRTADAMLYEENNILYTYPPEGKVESIVLYEPYRKNDLLGMKNIIFDAAFYSADGKTIVASNYKFKFSLQKTPGLNVSDNTSEPGRENIRSFARTENAENTVSYETENLQLLLKYLP